MPSYSCPRCGYTNSIRTHIRNHFSRKNICLPTIADISKEECYKTVLNENFLEGVSVKQCRNLKDINENIPKIKETIDNKGEDKNKCRYCDKSFTHRQNKWRHEKKCVLIFKKMSINEEELKENVVTDLEIKNIENETYKLIIEKDNQINTLKSQIETLIGKNPAPSVVQNIQGDQNNVNIYLNAFGQENIKYITDTIIEKLISMEPVNAVPKLLQQIHFHPNHMENHNIYIPNKSKSFAKIFDGQKWIYTKKKRQSLTWRTKL